MVVAVGVARTIFAIAEDFAHPLVEDDFNTLLRAFGPPLILEITDCPLFALGFNLPVSMRSRASESNFLKRFEVILNIDVKRHKNKPIVQYIWLTFT